MNENKNIVYTEQSSSMMIIQDGNVLVDINDKGIVINLELDKCHFLNQQDFH